MYPVAKIHRQLPLWDEPAVPIQQYESAEKLTQHQTWIPLFCRIMCLSAHLNRYRYAPVEAFSPR